MKIFLGIVNTIILALTAYFIYRSIRSPINAVRVGRDLDTQAQKDNAKRNLFLLLFSLRGTPVHYDFVRGLNQIDIVFRDNPTVLSAWHSHYRDLNTEGLVDENKIWEIGRVRMLSAMAAVLGYGGLEQSNIMEHYTPVGHHYKNQYDFDLQEAATQYFRKGSAMYDALAENAKNNKDSSGQEVS
jgi:hypothetical protein